MELVESWSIHTDVFDGPLDLLLYLVRREGIDLRTFQVRQVTDAYLEYIAKMRELHLGVAGEYLVMAATLCYLKSLELLPRPPTALEEEEEDPRDALARQLREYQQLREAADSLEQRLWVGREVFVRDGEEVDASDRPLVSPVDAFGLLDIYFDLLKQASAPAPEIEVVASGPDVVACARGVLARLAELGGRGELGALLLEIPGRIERITTFIGVLEMARLRWLGITQAEHLGPVELEARVGPDADFGMLAP